MNSPHTRSPLGRIHPMIILAAVAVSLLSLTGIAALMGWLPTANSAPGAVVQAGNGKSILDVFKPKCVNCGTIDSVTTHSVQGQGSGVGAVVGGVVGGVLGNQVGGGRGKDAATVVGVLGGAYAGNEVEKNNKRSYRYVVKVRLDDGGSRSFTFSQPPAWRSGDRVKVDGDSLVRVN
jgi:outer membrane lipoprotein SlyB